MDLSDDAKKQALEAARGVKDTLRTETLKATPETTEEMQTGSPRTPKVDEHSGKTMKKAAEYDFEPREEPPDPEPGANAFERALAEKLQESTPASSDKSHDIDR